MRANVDHCYDQVASFIREGDPKEKEKALFAMELWYAETQRLQSVIETLVKDMDKLDDND